MEDRGYHRQHRATQETNVPLRRYRPVAERGGKASLPSFSSVFQRPRHLPWFPKAVMPSVVIGVLALIVLVVALHPTQQGTSYTLVFGAFSSSSQGPQSTPTVTVKATPVLTIPNVSRRLARIAQLDPAQYASTSQYNAYAYSACSAASMTEVLNAWAGYAKYRIADVLSQEIAVDAISSSEGLLDNGGIGRTMAHFGFSVTTPSLSLDQVINEANSGIPIIVGWPPALWPGGHLLVVIGGNGAQIHLADSSSYNYTWMSRALFASRWAGFAAIATPML